jgi:hypothetical protein
MIRNVLRGESKVIRPGDVNRNAIQTLCDGILDVAIGIRDGLWGLLADPIKGAQNDALRGGANGLLRGLIGIVLSPVAAVMYGVAGVTGPFKKVVDGGGVFVWRKRRPRAIRYYGIEPFDTVRELAQ